MRAMRVSPSVAGRGQHCGGGGGGGDGHGVPLVSFL